MFRKITATLNITSEENYPVMVTADFNCEYDRREGWNWEIDKITCIELHIGGGKTSIDITKQVKADSRALAIISADAANCDQQIYEQLKGVEVAA